MAVLSLHLRPDLPREQRQAVARVERRSKALLDECTQAVRLCARTGDWSLAIKVANHGARLTPAEIASELGVMRSTVSRWMDGTMAPHAKSIPELLEKLIRAIKGQAA